MPRKTVVQERDVELEQIIDESCPGEYNRTQLVRISRLITQGLTEAEWSGLEKDYELPPRARDSIQHVIGSYWLWRTKVTFSVGLVPKIRAAITDIKRLRASLSSLRGDRDYFRGLYAYYQLTPKEELSLIDNTLDQLSKMDRSLAEAIIRTKRPAHRPSHRAIWYGLCVLMVEMELYWDNYKMVSGVDSVAYRIIALADPRVTKRTLVKMLDEFISENPEGSWTDRSLEPGFDFGAPLPGRF